jgi:hypothetical protein
MDASEVNFIPISEVRSEAFIASQPPQTYQLKAPKTGSYSRCYMSYNRGTPEQPVIDEGLFELSICKGEVEEKVNEDGTMGIQLKLMITNPDDQAGLDRAYMGCAGVVGLYKGQFGQPHFNPQTPHGVVKNPLYRFINKQTGELIQGATPVLWCKIDENGKKKSKFKQFKPKKNEDGTFMYDEHGEPVIEEIPISPRSLAGKDLEVSVVIHYSDIYKGSTISPQVKSRSVVVLDVKGAGSVEHGKSSQLLNHLKEKLQTSPDSFDTLATEFEKLRTSAKAAPAPSLLKPADPPQTGLPQAGVPPGFPQQQLQITAPQQQLQIGAPPGFPQQPGMLPQQVPQGFPQQGLPQGFPQQVPQMGYPQQMGTPHQQGFPQGLPQGLSVPSTPGPITQLQVPGFVQGNLPMGTNQIDMSQFLQAQTQFLPQGSHQ